MPRSTLVKLASEGVPMRPSVMVVRAFDGEISSIMGEIDLSMRILAHVFQITFQVTDINPTYICLLGRLCINVFGVVTSTLHQLIKFVVKDKLVIVFGEDMMVSHLSSLCYIEADEGSLEISF